MEDKLTRARELIKQRDEIDDELRVLFGEVTKPRRSRPRKEDGDDTQTQLPITTE